MDFTQQPVEAELLRTISEVLQAHTLIIWPVDKDNPSGHSEWKGDISS